MAVTRYLTVNNIVNRVAVQVGLSQVDDVFSSGDPAFTRLISLLDASLEQLFEDIKWSVLKRDYQYTTIVADTGVEDLPADFGYMIEQTGWERSQNVPLLGPLTAQDWTHLLGRDLAGNTLYASFRFTQDKLYIFPNESVPVGLDINFEYISRNWYYSAVGVEYCDEASDPSDQVLLPPRLVTTLLKKNYLEATGFSSQAATDDYLRSREAWKGHDKSAPVLNAASGTPGPAYIDVFRNVSDTGFGGP